LAEQALNGGLALLKDRVLTPAKTDRIVAIARFKIVMAAGDVMMVVSADRRSSAWQFPSPNALTRLMIRFDAPTSPIYKFNVATSVPERKNM